MGIIRRAAELLLGALVIRRCLPVNHGGGAIVVSSRVGGLKYLMKSAEKWDADLLHIAAQIVKKGDTVWDIGTNVGLFSKAAAFHAGPNGAILSIEADMDAVALLNRTCRYRSSEHAEMTVLHVAVSETVGFVKFAISKRARASNSIEGYGSTQTGGVASIRTLPCVSLDSMLDHFEHPDVVKIDVEGAEMMVLKGGGRILGKVRPALYCEVSSRSSNDVTNLLQRHDYKLWDGCGFSGTKSQEILKCTHNTVAIPQEKVGEYCI